MHHLSARRAASTAAALTLAAAACADPSSSPTAPSAGAGPLAAQETAPGQERGQPIPGQYIVVFRDGVTDVRGRAAEKARRVGGGVERVYERALRGFAGPMSEAAAEALRQDPDVAYVEQDQVVTIDATQTGATWGLDRIDQVSLPLNSTYTYTGDGSAVTAYIIDTGILPGHAEFGTRAQQVYNSADRKNSDCNGHGTHVAGTVGGATYGVAKAVQLRGVKVLNCRGSGTNSGVIAGIDWVANNHVKPAVANLSLGGGISDATDAAVTNLVNVGVFVAVAAGNSTADACTHSPARAPKVTTVGATTSADARASYSNFGTCVDLFAPGSSITSAWHTSTTALNTISGTSMASPHVAGVGALILGANRGATPAAVDSAVKSRATRDKVTDARDGSPNLLLHMSGL